MADAENRRKCFKCGSSFALDNVKLFRFPKPAKRNLVRCEICTQYIFPEKDYSSTELQTKLHTEHIMLYQKHFKDDDFTDASKTKLIRTAVPSDTIAEFPTMGSTIKSTIEPQPGPLYRATLCDITNLQESSSTTVNCELVTLKKTAEKMDFLREKCTKYVKKICLLNKRSRTLKSKNLLIAIEEDKNVIKLSTHIAPAFVLLLQGQMRNEKRKKQGRRWLKEEKIIALRIYKRSPTCNRLLQRLFPLPSPST